jgi:hypothetical protein
MSSLLQVEITLVNSEIDKVNADICRVELKLQELEEARNVGSNVAGDIVYWREEKRQLRNKETQLRNEETQLRAKELIQLQLPRAVDGSSYSTSNFFSHCTSSPPFSH